MDEFKFEVPDRFKHIDFKDYVATLDKFYKCNDCGINTATTGETYMVKKPVWKQAGMDTGILCIGCLEKKLGRHLNSEDFLPNSPMNQNLNRKSLRLRNRMTS